VARRHVLVLRACHRRLDTNVEKAIERTAISPVEGLRAPGAEALSDM